MSSLLDTGILSQPLKAQPHAAATQWWQKQDASTLWISAMSIQEIRFGIEIMPSGRKRQALDHWLTHIVLVDFHERILPVDEVVADISGRILAAAKKAGHTAEAADCLIAATAKAHGLKVATLNRKHFTLLGVELVSF